MNLKWIRNLASDKQLQETQGSQETDAASSFFSDVFEAMKEGATKVGEAISEGAAKVSDAINEVTDKGRVEACGLLETHRNAYEPVQTRLHQLTGRGWYHDREKLSNRIESLKQVPECGPKGPKGLHHLLSYIEPFNTMLSNYADAAQLQQNHETKLNTMAGMTANSDKNTLAHCTGPSQDFLKELKNAETNLAGFTIPLSIVELYSDTHHQLLVDYVSFAEKTLTSLEIIKTIEIRLKKLNAQIVTIEQALKTLENAKGASRAAKYESYKARLANLKTNYANWLGQLSASGSQMQAFLQLIEQELPFQKESNVAGEAIQNAKRQFAGLVSPTKYATIKKDCGTLSADTESLNNTLASSEGTAALLLTEIQKVQKQLIAQDQAAVNALSAKVNDFQKNEKSHADENKNKCEKLKQKWDQIVRVISQKNKETVQANLDAVEALLLKRNKDIATQEVRLNQVVSQITQLVNKIDSNASVRESQIQSLQDDLNGLEKQNDAPLSDKNNSDALMNQIEGMLFDLHKFVLKKEIIESAGLLETKIHENIHFLTRVLRANQNLRNFRKNVVAFFMLFSQGSASSWEFIQECNRFEAAQQKLEKQKTDFQKHLKKFAVIKKEREELYSSEGSCTSFSTVFKALSQQIESLAEVLSEQWELSVFEEESSIAQQKTDLKAVYLLVQKEQQNLSTLGSLHRKNRLLDVTDKSVSVNEIVLTRSTNPFKEMESDDLVLGTTKDQAELEDFLGKDDDLNKSQEDLPVTDNKTVVSGSVSTNIDTHELGDYLEQLNPEGLAAEMKKGRFIENKNLPDVHKRENVLFFDDVIEYLTKSMHEPGEMNRMEALFKLQDRFGNTLLHGAVIIGNSKFVEAFLVLSDRDIKNDKGETALDVAKNLHAEKLFSSPALSEKGQNTQQELVSTAKEICCVLLQARPPQKIIPKPLVVVSKDDLSEEDSDGLQVFQSPLTQKSAIGYSSVVRTRPPVLAGANPS